MDYDDMILWGSILGLLFLLPAIGVPFLQGGLFFIILDVFFWIVFLVGTWRWIKKGTGQ